MFRIDRICIWLLFIGFILLIPSITIFKYGDELVVYSLLICAMIDCIFNRQWRKYRLLLTFLAVMTFYLVYSLTIVHYNTANSVLYGWILEMKPFIPLLVFMGVAPKLQPTDKKILKGIAFFNLAAMIAFLPMYNWARYFIFSHDALYGGIALTTSVIYLYCSLDPDTGFTRKGLLVFWITMAIGLVCMRSKFYGEFVVALFLIYVYRQQMTRHLTLPRIIVFTIFSVVLVAAIWDKFSTYFLMGIDLSSLDLSRMEELARLALYAMAPTVLMMHPLFGTGLASYASMASGDPGYSGIYAETHLDKVYGLSPDFHDFICDAYYPSLAQFGFVGIILFIWLWVKVYNQLRPLTRCISNICRAQYIIGAFILISVFIEMTTGTMVFMAPGEILLMILGMICSVGTELKAEATLADTTDHDIPSSSLTERRI